MGITCQVGVFQFKVFRVQKYIPHSNKENEISLNSNRLPSNNMFLFICSFINGYNQNTYLHFSISRKVTICWGCTTLTRSYKCLLLIYENFAKKKTDHLRKDVTFLLFWKDWCQEVMFTFYIVTSIDPLKTWTSTTSYNVV